MLFWFVGGALTIVWYVFSDPAIPVVPLVAGVLMPDVVDGISRRLVLHSMVLAVGLMAIVMLATFGRRPVRRKLLMVPFGMLLHLVLDGIFARTKVFWWPLSGGSPVRASLPSFDRRWWVIVLLEVIGLIGIRAHLVRHRAGAG